MSNTTAIILFLVGGLAFFITAALGVIFIILSVRNKKKAQASTQWPSVAGQVSNLEITRNNSQDADGNLDFTYTPIVHYSYQVGGQAFTSDKIAFGAVRNYGLENKAREVLAQYPLGSPVTVYYNPQNPAEAVLKTSASGGRVTLIVGIALLVISLCVVCPLFGYLLYQNL